MIMFAMHKMVIKRNCRRHTPDAVSATSSLLPPSPLFHWTCVPFLQGRVRTENVFRSRRLFSFSRWQFHRWKTFTFAPFPSSTLREKGLMTSASRTAHRSQARSNGCEEEEFAFMEINVWCMSYLYVNMWNRLRCCRTIHMPICLRWISIQIEFKADIYISKSNAYWRALSLRCAFNQHSTCYWWHQQFTRSM